MDDALNLDVRRFCADVVIGALEWLRVAESTPEYQQNYPRFLQRYPDGLPPSVVGVPVLA